jgi:hypothetical protein
MSDFNNITVFMRVDGSVCDPWDQDVYVCATFAIGGKLMEYRWIAWDTDDQHGSYMQLLAVDVVTSSTPILCVDDVRSLLDHVVVVPEEA